MKSGVEDLLATLKKNEVVVGRLSYVVTWAEATAIARALATNTRENPRAFAPVTGASSAAS